MIKNYFILNHFNLNSLLNLNFLIKFNFYYLTTPLNIMKSESKNNKPENVTSKNAKLLFKEIDTYLEKYDDCISDADKYTYNDPFRNNPTLDNFQIFDYNISETEEEIYFAYQSESEYFSRKRSAKFYYNDNEFETHSSYEEEEINTSNASSDELYGTKYSTLRKFEESENEDNENEDEDNENNDEDNEDEDEINNIENKNNSDSDNKLNQDEIISNFTDLDQIFLKKFYKRVTTNKKQLNKTFLNFLFDFNLKPQSFNLLPDELPLIDLLKINQLRLISTKNINSSIGIITLKSSGINNFFTLINENGNVLVSLSGGIFKNVKKIKEKKSLNIVRHLGQLMSYYAYKCNFNYIFLKLKLTTIQIRSILKNFYQGFIILFKLYIFKILLDRPIIRNGIKYKKLPRK